MTAKVNVGNTYGIASSMETRLGNVSKGSLELVPHGFQASVVFVKCTFLVLT